MGKSVAVRVPVGAPPAGAARTYVGHELVGRVVLGLLRLHDVAVGDVDVEPREVLHRFLPVIHRKVILEELVLSCRLGRVEALLEQLDPEDVVERRVPLVSVGVEKQGMLIRTVCTTPRKFICFVELIPMEIGNLFSSWEKMFIF